MWRLKAYNRVKEERQVYNIPLTFKKFVVVLHIARFFFKRDYRLGNKDHGCLSAWIDIAGPRLSRLLETKFNLAYLLLL